MDAEGMRRGRRGEERLETRCKRVGERAVSKGGRRSTSDSPSVVVALKWKWMEKVILGVNKRQGSLLV